MMLLLNYPELRFCLYNSQTHPDIVNHLPKLIGGKVEHIRPCSLFYLQLKGLSIAALTAAIVASLAGKVNSISTIYTLDIPQKIFQKRIK